MTRVLHHTQWFETHLPDFPNYLLVEGSAEFIWVVIWIGYEIDVILQGSSIFSTSSSVAFNQLFTFVTNLLSSFFMYIFFVNTRMCM